MMIASSTLWWVGWRRVRPVPCTSATPARSCWRGCRSARAVALYCCASRTSTVLASSRGLPQTLEDLRWLGLDWDGRTGGAERARLARYRAGRRTAGRRGARLPVRVHAQAEIEEAASAPHEAGRRRAGVSRHLPRPVRVLAEARPRPGASRRCASASTWPRCRSSTASQGPQAGRRARRLRRAEARRWPGLPARGRRRRCRRRASPRCCAPTICCRARRGSCCCTARSACRRRSSCTCRWWSAATACGSRSGTATRRCAGSASRA
jgi:hypothetical protein